MNSILGSKARYSERVQRALLLSAAFLCSVFPARGQGQAQAQIQLPDGNGKEIVEKACSKCHDLNSITRSGYAQEEWEKIVTDMVSKGASVGEDQIPIVIEYMAKNFPDKSLKPVVIPGSQSNVIEIRALGSNCFAPIGLYIEPGQTVRWRLGQGGAIMAYHPKNYNHELRIPENATPFNSEESGRTGPFFELTLTEPGTYDYFNRPTEMLGIVGRIVVGQPGGPGEKPIGYGGREGHAPIYRDARRVFGFLDSEEIVKKKRIPCPAELLQRQFPLH